MWRACFYVQFQNACLQDLSWDNIVYTQYNNKNILWNTISSIKAQGSQNTNCLV